MGTFPRRGFTTRLGERFFGYAAGDHAVMADIATDHTLVTLQLSLALSGTAISGSFHVAFGMCAGTSGPFQARRAG